MIESALPPPTDNLYKFMAIGGLVLLVAGIVYPQIRKEQIEPDRIAVYQQVDEMSHVIQECVTAGDIVNARRKREGRDNVDRKELDAAFAKFLATAPVFEKADRVYRMKAQTLTFWRWVGYSGATVGGILSVIGFWLWRTRLQRPQDQLLRHEVESKRRTSSDDVLPAPPN